MADWRLEVLGGARLQGLAEPLELQRRVAAVLAWLALEGPTPKYRLAGMLWPGSGEDTARNNMRQLLRRLRVATGADLVLGGDVISLSERVATDAVELEGHVFAGRHAQALSLAGSLLGTLDFDDCPDFDAWVLRAREQLEALRRRAASAEADTREQQGDLAGALHFAERLLVLDPLSEEAYRRLMRLHYLSGDRMAALSFFERCQRMLREEYDATPHPDTLALARDVERGQVRPRAAVSKPGRTLPLSVLRPPVLVGRAREWVRMEAAWQSKQLILLLAEAGVGKTRLLHDFAASKGPFMEFSARPGDADVPYSLYVRHLRECFSARPELARGLEPWIRRELARVMPELAPGEEIPPMRNEGERVRCLDAYSEVLRRCTEGMASLLCDDLQFADPASLEVGAYAHSRFQEAGTFPVIIDCCRSGELRGDALVITKRLEAAGLALILELEPLPLESVGELLESLALPGASSLTGEMTRYTGGNPLFITETLKHLMESGSLERGWPERLPPPGRVRPLIQHRLERLSPLALQLAQVAALALMEFTLELAGEVLEVSPLSFAEPLRELEAAQIFRGERFTHDLVLEAVRGSLPAALGALLHRRLAQQLEKRRAAPTIIALHWLEGGESRRAVPFLLAAAQADEAHLRRAEASTSYARAASILESAGEVEEAARVRNRVPSA
ncbi:BTAD domain-containing putative transcriptional regulator [Vitiosangium sp. GDMCC 1.1324]|uniref:BTAD domain-containing putative transcriptional regulator n=1 Tax=Vitiosangium sp. (strain GDMCC 1.1324) TaxID=2138576 RepID=UPI0027120F7B|nr:BTAD domain-containing putative transcriptional regulator [Vitiosangium sp. GDMCC 1.1324]